MLETKEQKQIFGACVVLLILLVGISVWRRSSFYYSDQANYKKLQDQSKQKQQTYAQFLASMGTSAEAQKAMLEEILPPAEIQAEVARQLDVNQTIVKPDITDSQIKVSASSGKAAMQDYLQASGPLFEQLKTVTDSGLDDIYNPSGDRNKVDSLIADVRAAVDAYKKIAVPREGLSLHKNILTSLLAYQDLLEGSLSKTSSWPNMYKNYVIINQSLAGAGIQFQQLNTKYNLLGDAGSPSTAGNWLVPAAQAQFAVVDIWAKAQEILNEVVATSVAQFMLAFIDQLTTKIEQTYRITNFLYYTDALVSGQYVDDYLNKYVNDSLDRSMIKNFIPAVSCGGQNYQQVFQAKADQFLGFDPQSLDPQDPQYYQKLARVGDFLSSPQGWQLYYEDAAAQAEAQAQGAASNELNSPGLKAGRDITGSIITPVEVPLGTLRAAFVRYLSEGRSDQQSSVVEKVTSQITQTFLNNFVFQGAVYQEQKACISIPQVQLVTPVPLSSLP